jgi:hypothetical protein
MKVKLLLFSLILSVSLITCKKNEENKNSGNGGLGSIVVTRSSCKSHFIILAGSGYDCIKYAYLNGTLYIKHINAAFNCCPGKTSADAVITDSLIIVEEKSALNDCDCMCLFDLEYNLSAVKKGKIHLFVKEPYVDDTSNKLEFQMDLNQSDTGTFCVPRNSYPWGI